MIKASLIFEIMVEVLYGDDAMYGDQNKRFLDWKMISLPSK